MTEEERLARERKFKFRLRLEQELAAESAPESQALTEEAPADQTLADKLYAQEPIKGDLYSQPEFALNRRGVRRGVRDPVDAIGQMVNRNPEYLEGLRQQEEEYQAARKGAGRTGFDPNRLLGNVISTAAPGLGAARGISAATIPGKLATGTATGAGYGLLTPAHDENFWGQKLQQGRLGAMFGGAMPVAGMGVKAGLDYGKKLLNPWTKAGRQREVTDFLRGQVGPDRERVIAAMQNARQQVPGNQPTAGQAIIKATTPGDEFGSGLVKLESELAKQNITGTPLRNRYASQAAGREKLINALAGTDDAMDKARKARSSVTDPLYKRVDESTAQVNTSPVIGKIDDILSKNKGRTSIENPLGQLKSKLESAEATPQNMMSLSGEIKDMMGKITPGGQKEYNIGALDKIKTVLDTQIGKSDKAYRVAQTLYRRKSRPINRMQIGQELKKALINPAEQERASAFLNAMQNAPRTMKRATGFNRFNELGDVLTPAQVKTTKSIADELVTQAAGKKTASSVSSVLKELPSEVTITLPKILSRPIVIANHVLARLGKDSRPEYRKILTDMLKDPQSLEKALSSAPGSERHKLATEIFQQLTTITAVKGGNEAGVTN